MSLSLFPFQIHFSTSKLPSQLHLHLHLQLRLHFHSFSCRRYPSDIYYAYQAAAAAATATATATVKLTLLHDRPCQPQYQTRSLPRRAHTVLFESNIGTSATCS